MALYEFRGRERVWQYYTQKQWPFLIKSAQAGSMEVRADLRWFQELFRSDPKFQEEIFGKTYPQVAKRLLPYIVLSRLFLFLALVVSTWAAWEYAPQLLGQREASFIAIPLVWMVEIIIFSRHINASCQEPKSPQLLFTYLLFFLLVAFLGSNYLEIVVAVGLYFLAMIFVNGEYWSLRQRVIKLLASDYEFFRQVSGRPLESNERPPVCFLQYTGDEKKPFEWGANPEPALSPNITEVLNTIILGWRRDVCLSKMSGFLLLFLIVFFSFYPQPDHKLNWGLLVGGCAVLLLVGTYVCPSWYYIQFRNAKDLERRRTREVVPEFNIQAQWLFTRLLILFFWMALLAFLAEWSVGHFPDLPKW